MKPYKKRVRLRRTLFLCKQAGTISTSHPAVLPSSFADTDQQSDPYPGRSFRQIRSTLIHPCRTGNIQMRPCTLTNKFLQKHPAEMEPTVGPPAFFMSATSLSISSPYSSQRGSCQTLSPQLSPASMRLLTRLSSFPIRPVTKCPRATTRAPVSVAISIRGAGLYHCA